VSCCLGSFIVPAQPIERTVPPSGPEWVHEIKNDELRREQFLDECSLFVLRVHPGGLSVIPEDCPYKVIRTNGDDEIAARATNLLIGRAASETAKRMFPDDPIEYRHLARVLDRSGREESS
jgi:hypothetical protein